MSDELVHLLSAQESGWTQIAVLGQFKDPRYGKFAITRDMVDSWVRNLSAVTGQPRVAIDYDHRADPSFGGHPSTRAAGWITAIKLDGNAVMAKVDWTPAAEDAIRNGEYAFFSPTFAKHYRNQSGQDLGPTLLGGALTNRPHLRDGMRPITLDAYREVVTMSELSSKERDALPASAFVFPEDRRYPIHDIEHARNALARCSGKPEEAKVKAAVYKRYPQLRPDSTSLSAREDSQGMTDFLIRLTQSLGLADDASEDEIIAAVENGSVVHTLAQARGLQLVARDEIVRLTQAAEAGERAIEEQREQRFTLAYERGVSEGRIAPAQQETLHTLYQSDPETTLKLMDNAEPLVPVKPGGDTGKLQVVTSGSSRYKMDDYEVDADALALHQQIEARAKADGVDYTTAAMTLAQEGVA